MKTRELTPAEVRRTIRVLSNWPEVRRPYVEHAVGAYTDEIGAARPDDLDDYEYRQRSAA